MQLSIFNDIISTTIYDKHETFDFEIMKLFYGDLVNKFKTIVGTYSLSAQLIKIFSCYKKIDYYINVLQQTACLVVNPIVVGNVYLFPL